MIISSTVHEAIQRDLSHTGVYKTEETVGKGVNLAWKILVIFPCKPCDYFAILQYVTVFINSGLEGNACGIGL